MTCPVGKVEDEGVIRCPKIKERQTIQLAQKKGQKDKQWSTKHYTEN